MLNRFVWINLSTFDIVESKRFYERCFDWQSEFRGDDQVQCYSNDDYSAGIQSMSARLQQMGMPSVWVPYIQVEGLEEVVQRAQVLGGKIEQMPEKTYGGRMAIVRDPAGARFICFEGNLYNRTPVGEAPNLLGWNELYVSSVDSVKNFYAMLFCWNIQPDDNEIDRYIISDRYGRPLGAIQACSSDVRGEKEYWAPYIGVQNIEYISDKIQQLGGQIIWEYPLGDRPSLAAHDTRGATFYAIELEDVSVIDASTLTDEVQDTYRAYSEQHNRQRKKGKIAKFRVALVCLLVCTAAVFGFGLNLFS